MKPRFLYSILAAFLLIAAVPGVAQDEAASAPQPPETTPAADEGPAEVKILLAEFESDDAFNAHSLFKKDLIRRIQERGLAHVTLDTWDEMVEGVSFKDAALNAQRVASRHGYDMVVWGGSTGLTTTVAVTTVSGEGESFWRFVNLGANQIFQIPPLDLDFRKVHPMIADYVVGIVGVRSGDYEQALRDFESTLSYDPDNLLSLNVLRLNLGACHLQRFVENGEADEGRKAILHLARALDEVKEMGDPSLYGALKVCLYHTYRRMAAAVPKSSDLYRRKAAKSLADALHVFKEKEFPELHKLLTAERKSLTAD